MKKLFIALVFMLYAGLNAQTFDFACESQQQPIVYGEFSHTATPVNVDGYIYDTTVVWPGERNLTRNGSIGNGNTWNGTNDLWVAFPVANRWHWDNGDHVIVKYTDNDVLIGKLSNRTTYGSGDGQTEAFRVNIIQPGGFDITTYGGRLTVGEIAPPVAGPFMINGYTYSDYEQPNDALQVRYDKDIEHCSFGNRWFFTSNTGIRIHHPDLPPYSVFGLEFYNGDREFFYATPATTNCQNNTFDLTRIDTRTNGNIDFGTHANPQFPMDGGDIQQQKVKVWSIAPDFIRDLSVPTGWEVDLSTVRTSIALGWYEVIIRKTGCTEAITFYREHVNNTDTYNGLSTIDAAIAALTSCN